MISYLHDKRVLTHPVVQSEYRPILKWAGGKRQLLPHLLRKIPDEYDQYIEPFAGGAALFFALAPQKAVLSDTNPELINLYEVVTQNVEGLIRSVSRFKTDENTYYSIRSQDPGALTEVQRAARTLYLNRIGFNGLYRVNRSGQFNVPYGRHNNPRVCDSALLSEAQALLSKATLICADCKAVLRKYAGPGDFVYLDPPYLPVSTYSDFKRYTKEQFYEEDHIALAQEVRRLHELGCFVLLTNSNHPLVYDLYSGFDIEVVQTRRSINRVASRRVGEDVIIFIPPKTRLLVRETAVAILPAQASKFPATRFMGSKQALLSDISAVASAFDFKSVLDLFSGTGSVGYMFKAQGKRVICNDYMAFCAAYAKALVENNDVRLSADDLEMLCSTKVKTDNFVSTTFKGLYFRTEENHFLDCVRANILHLNNRTKRALAISALVRACLKKRPRGVFTYTGERYNDGRRDLNISLKDHFLNAVHALNNAVFDNGQANMARFGDALTIQDTADLVYIDPPYYSPLSDNEYVRRYHFVEGLARYWRGVEIQKDTKTKKFKSYPTPFSSRGGAHSAFEKLFETFRDKILIVSYSSNSMPTRDEIIALMSRFKERVEVVAVDHRYSFGNQRDNIEKNKVKEFLFVGY